jgi:hypothetical protein
MAETFFNSSDIYRSLETAKLLSKCGTSFPEDSTVCQVESLPQALETIGGSLLDAVPHSTWDRTFVHAFRQSRQVLQKREGVLTRLFFGNKLRERQRRIQGLVAHSINQSPFASKLTKIDRKLVVSHLAEMLNVVSLVLDAKCAAEWPLLIKATDCAFRGYLPVDFEGTVEPRRVLVY